jgi:hypothetical protein
MASANSQLTDMFWFSDPKVLVNGKRLFEVFPSRNYTFARKLNSLVRLSVFFALVMYVVKKDTKYVVVPIIVMGLSWFIHYKQNVPVSDEKPKVKPSPASTTLPTMKPPVESECLLPTRDNPFMNPHFQDFGNDNALPPKSCLTYNNVGLQGKVENLFETDLYRDVSDIFGKENSQRQFYTVPGNQVPNDQGAFAQWLYGTPPTCKEGNKTACSTNWVGPGGPAAS